jgi:hypothetical protein
MTVNITVGRPRPIPTPKAILSLSEYLPDVPVEAADGVVGEWEVAMLEAAVVVSDVVDDNDEGVEAAQS